jgi:Zn finger protein HypA/HybF involved in hydrogenase expression
MSAHKGHCTGKNSTEHLVKFRAWSKGMFFDKDKNQVDDPRDILIEGSPHSTGHVKKVILAFRLKEYQCECCGLSDWLGKPIVLELDHINGINNDHRIENVRFLCPNCHSQTENFRGRNKNTGQVKVDDDTLKEALKSESSIRAALIKVGLSPKGGNYERCYKLLGQI